jgi:hypothetical protein
MVCEAVTPASCSRLSRVLAVLLLVTGSRVAAPMRTASRNSLADEADWGRTCSVSVEEASLARPPRVQRPCA